MHRLPQGRQGRTLTPSLTADAVDAAAQRLGGVVVPTPVHLSERLSALTGARVWLKREDLSPVRSYKLRGAYNLIAQLSETERAAGVVAASAGNHAQGVAFACAALGVAGRIYVPGTTPKQKRDRIVAIGGDVIELIVGGDTYDDASAAAKADAARTGATLVHAFDDARTVAGQGTLIREAFSQFDAMGEPRPGTVVIPVGGGGLLAGALTWLAERAPGTRVVGVEPASAACMIAALAAGGPVTLESIDTFVDGAAVRRAGDVTYPVVAASGVELVTVPEGRICVEMLALYQVDGIIAEPAGALAAAAWDALGLEAGESVLVVLSGGNNDVSRYAEVIERALVFEGRKHYFLVDFPQEPGALRRFLEEVLGPDDDITLFEYVKQNNREFGPALVGLELGGADTLPAMLARMEASPLHIERITPDSPLYRYIR